MKRYQKVFSILFLLLTGLLLAGNLFYNTETIGEHIQGIEIPKTIEEINGVTLQVDSILSENLVGNHMWNEMYGAVYRILGKNEENNFTYVKDKNNYLYSGNFWNTSMTESLNLALRMRKFSDAMKETGTQVVFFLYPTKYREEWTEGYTGIPYNGMNDFADEFLRHLRRYNVDYIDFREEIDCAGITLEEGFYKTDHHWNTKTAFWATGVIVDYLQDRYGDDWDPEDFYMNLENYDSELYEGIYLGAQGRETGVLYAEELDDYLYLYPKFETKFTYSYQYLSGEAKEKEGDISKTLINKEAFKHEDIYDRELSNSYLYGVCLKDEITNELLEDGRKVLFLRDSNSSPIAVFLSPMCKKIDCNWVIHRSEEEIYQQVQNEDYDYIFVALTIDNLTSEGIPMFQYEVEEELKYRNQ